MNHGAVPKSDKEAFSLVEVLIALAIAALGFGVVLHSVGRQMTLVASSVERHQLLMHASQLLEQNMAAGVTGSDGVESPLRDPAAESLGQELQISEFLYTLNARPVTADPRVQQVTVGVRKGRARSNLSAYRLRVRRESNESSDES